jgi:pimeloyl-ACP methyl ester carboxylesterase
MSDRRRRRFGVLGAVLGVAAAGVAAGVAAERALVRRLRDRTDDPYAGEPFGRLPFDESLTVTSADGVELHVEVVDPADGVELDAGFAAGFAAASAEPEPTVVFVHGFCLDMTTFHFQRKELTRRGDWRAVYYDQPGHGRSGRLADGEYELAALAEALRAVIEATTPAGPVVLVGHSMGGMTVMAFAERFPELFAQRVAGVVLISSSAGRPDDSAFGLPDLFGKLGRPILPLVNGATRLTGGVIDRARRAASDLAWLLTRRYGFGTDRPSPSLVSFVERTIARTQVETVARYLRTLHQHTLRGAATGGEPGGPEPTGPAPGGPEPGDPGPDGQRPEAPSARAALQALRGVPVLLICGEKDPITPLAHTTVIQSRLPAAELVVVPDSGHLVLLEHPEEVNAALLAFLEKAG